MAIHLSWKHERPAVGFTQQCGHASGSDRAAISAAWADPCGQQRKLAVVTVCIYGSCHDGQHIPATCTGQVASGRRRQGLGPLQGDRIIMCTDGRADAYGTDDLLVDNDGLATAQRGQAK